LSYFDLDDFEDFLEEVNEGEWDMFFATLGKDSTVAFVECWDD